MENGNMKKNIKVILALLSTTLALSLGCNQTNPRTTVCPAAETEACSFEVSKRLAEISSDIAIRLDAFAAEVANDQLFSLRLIAEDNRSAPEVTAKAGQFMKPMGFSVLTIIDSASIILSSGDFAASVGNSAVEKAALLDAEPKVIIDQVMGKNVVTLQARKSIKIVDGIPFSAIGGVVIDDDFLARLSVRRGVTTILKQGNTVIGMNGVRTISEIKDNRIVIDNKEYGACRIDLPFAGTDAGGVPELIVIVQPAAAAPAGK